MDDSGTSQDSLLQTLGRYKVLRRIGKGGMGDVWLCEDLTLHRQVAVKTLPFHNQRDREHVLRFEREAQAAATLNHPHILRVHDYGQQPMPNGEAVTYIVMPYVTGGSLSNQMSIYKKQQLLMPPLAALQYLQQAAEAIDYAHRQGLIHRDIKPANMLLRDDNWLLLADFGLARVLYGVEKLTETGAGFGTPHYMAPEQARGKAEFASDIYSLAIIAYQLFTDHFPFDANTFYAIMIQHMTMPVPPPQDFNPAITPMFAAALVQGLAKQPDQRPLSAGAFVNGLQRAWQHAPFGGSMYETLPMSSPAIQDDTPAPDSDVPIGMGGPTESMGAMVDINTPEPEPEPTPGHRSTLTRRQFLIGGGVALVVVGGGVGTWEYIHAHTSTTPKAVIAKPSQPQPLVLLGHNRPVASLVWSPTGILASAGSGDGQVMLWDVATLYHQPAGSKPLPKATQQFSTSFGMLLAWSPKGDMLAIANTGTVDDDIISPLLAIYNGDLSSYASGYSNTFAIKNVSSIDGLIWAPSDNFVTLTPSPLSVNSSTKYNLTAWDVKHPQQKLASFDLPYAIDAMNDQSPMAILPLAIAAHTTPLRLAYGIDAGVDVEHIDLTTQPPTIKKAISKPLDYDGQVMGTGSVAWSSDGQVLAAIPDEFNQPTSVTIWNFQDNTTQVQSLSGDAVTYLLMVAWSPAAGSTRLAGGGNNGTVYIWDVSKDLLPFGQKNPPASINGAVNALAWSADGQWLAAAYNDTNASIIIWKM